MTNINRLNPYPPALWADLDDFFHRAFPSFSRSHRSRRFAVQESDEGWLLRTDLPGYAKENVEVRVKDGNLRVSATETEENPGFVPGFEQRWRLSPKVDSANITARLQDGVLEIRLPLREEAQKPSFRVDVN